MKPKYLILTPLLLLIFLAGNAQDISVKSFQSLPNDQTARVHHPVKDQNGEKCALIKVVTTQRGFVWEGGTLGITKVEKKTGEYWVYVPRGSKKITIKHEELGILRDYHYPEAIKEATTYEMFLTTGQVKTVVEEREIPSQWLVINSEPEVANVFIDDKLAGTTPFQRKYKEGEYTYRLEKPRYHNKAGQISLEDERKRLELTLKPQFGNLQITSEPEDNMQIYLDDENTTMTTPATLEEVSSGEHTVMLNSKWYQPKTKKVTVRDEQTTAVDFTLEPAFANVSVTTQPEAEILIDDQVKGTGSWNGRMLEGIYTIKAQKDKYYSQSEQVEVIAGERETLNFTLKGKTGNADIVTTPMDAEVYLDDKKQGTSPLTLKNLLVGNYELRLEKEGYGIVKKTLTIEEDETLTVNETLPEGKEIRITSQPEGAKLFVDGTSYGKTPQKLTLSFGNHKVKLIDGSTTVEKSLDVTQFGEEQFEYSLIITGSFTDSRDGQIYEWVRIGDQVWMAENLNYDQSSYGNDWCYDNNSSNCDTYGRLYDWAAVMQGASSSSSNPSGVQGVCPDGWHVPSDEEWKELEMKLGMSQSEADGTGDRGTNEGSKLAGNAYLWNDGDLENNSEFGSSGFTALPGGDRYYYGDFYSIGYYGFWWSSKEYSSMNAWRRKLYYYYSNVHRHHNAKEYGFSVRCVRDD